MTTRPKAAKVSNVEEGILSDSNLNIGSYMAAADKLNLRLVSKAFNQAFFDNLKCANAQELQEELNDMRSEPEPCRNTAKVFFNPEKGIQRAIMCAIMSVDQKLHVYVDTGDLEPFLASESVKCFDKNYALKLTLLYPKAQQFRPPRPKLRCDGGFHRRKGGWARNGRLQDQRGVRVVRFTGNTHVAEQAFYKNQTLKEILDVDNIEIINKSAFVSSRSLKKIGNMLNLKEIKEGAFIGSSLEEVGDMPELTKIHGWAFDGSSLKEVGDMSKLKQIESHAFAETKLAKVDMPNLESIGFSAFLSCMSLEEVGDMKNLTIIKGLAFYCCRSLKKVGDMPNLKQIGPGAFSGCNSLQKIFLPKSLQNVRWEAFDGCPLEELSVEPGAEFNCYCENLASKLRLLKGVNVTGEKPPYKIQAVSLQASTAQGLTTRQIRLKLQKANGQAPIT